MKSLFICLAVFAIAALVCAKKGGKKCDEKMLEWACGPKGEEMMKKIIDKMEGDCKAKAEAIMVEAKPKFQTACAGRAGKTAETCDAMKAMLEDGKTKLGADCVSKFKKGKGKGKGKGEKSSEEK